MKKIAVFSDIHGNYQALDAILNDIKKYNYDDVIFLGDAIGIGPEPYKCLDRLLKSNITYIYGNHEMYILEGHDNFSNIKESAKPHHKWTENETKTLHSELKKRMIKDKIIENVKFMHYQFDDNGYILRPNDYPTIEYLDNIYNNINQEYIVFGHSHVAHYNIGKKHYYCLGSSGCVHDYETFYNEVTIDNGNVLFKKHYIKYNREEFINTVNKTDFPLKKFMCDVFFGIKVK